MVVLWISFALFLLYFLGQTAWGLKAFPRILEAVRTGALPRARLYAALMLGQWLPAAGVLLLTALGQFSPGDVGLAWFRPSGAAWLVIASGVAAGLYLVYLLLSLFSLRRNARRGADNSPNAPARLLPMFPATAREKRVWAGMALTAGFAEELLFRGFLFYALGTLFPALPQAAVLLLASALFALGHLYQGWKEALQPALLGLLFGAFYLAFGTVWPCVVLHALQDWCAAYVVNRLPALYLSPIRHRC